MMRNKLLAGLLAAAAFGAATPAAASVTVNYITSNGISGQNDFVPELNAAGLTSYTTTGASLILNEDSIITFEFLGSESGFADTISFGGNTYNELGYNSFAAPITLGSAFFSAGTLLNRIVFGSDQGVGATVGADGFGIFLTDGQKSGEQVSEFYLGFDDQVTNQDDNHDDYIVRATVRSAVPEPGTWAMMLIGFGGVGYSMRRKRTTALAAAV